MEESSAGSWGSHWAVVLLINGEFKQWLWSLALSGYQLALQHYKPGKAVYISEGSRCGNRLFTVKILLSCMTTVYLCTNLFWSVFLFTHIFITSLLFNDAAPTSNQHHMRFGQHIHAHSRPVMTTASGNLVNEITPVPNQLLATQVSTVHSHALLGRISKQWLQSLRHQALSNKWCWVHSVWWDISYGYVQ
jgi:hypothetical protein